MHESTPASCLAPNGARAAGSSATRSRGKAAPAVLAAALPLAWAAAAAGADGDGALPDPAAAYGGRLEFAVLRDGDPVGRHVVRFTEAPGGLLVDALFEIEVRLLFLTAYAYRHESRAEWRDGRLHRLTATVDDDGDASAVTAEATPGGLSVTGPAGMVAVEGPIFPTSHWNASVLGQSRVLNTITGAVNEVSIVPVGREGVQTELGPVEATRYAYAGDLEAEVLYDDGGRWVGMSFAARDGSAIEYACRRCQGG